MTVSATDILVRPSTVDDWPAIIDIYNQAVTDGNSTADNHPVSIDSRRDWLARHDERYPLLVALSNTRPVGWCSLGPWRPGRDGLRNTAEISYYIDRGYRRRGIARLLIESATEAARQAGHRNLLAILLDNNRPSIALLEQAGFTRWGHLPDIVDQRTGTCGQFIYGRSICNGTTR